jgi:hypothetical protein
MASRALAKIGRGADDYAKVEISIGLSFPFLD